MIKGIDYIGVSIVFFCHDGKGNILMQKRGQNTRDEKGRWDIGAGSIEFGHSIEHTLKKEILEEYGTDVLAYEFLGNREVLRHMEGQDTHWITFDYKVLVNRELAKNAEPHKLDEVGWFTLGTLPAPTHSQLSLFLEKYKDKL